MINGIINVYKEKGYTSHDVVAKMRGILKQKKIGHTGTLDPDATGVLPVCLGKATKLCGMLTDTNKEYEVEMLLGTTTDTEDTTGTILEQKPVEVSASLTEEIIMGFVGDYDQIPPMYSALKVNGKKLYELAREGKVIERKPRRIQILEIEILNIELPKVKMRVSCSKGTYIRSLCRDIGEKLGCGGCMSSLVRTRVSRFQLEESYTLDQITAMRDCDNLADKIIRIEDMFTMYPAVVVSKEYDKLIYNGNKFGTKHIVCDEEKEYDSVRVYDEGKTFIGIYQFSMEQQLFVPKKMFI